jgi:hypothetical protein
MNVRKMREKLQMGGMVIESTEWTDEQVTSYFSVDCRLNIPDVCSKSFEERSENEE